MLGARVLGGLLMNTNTPPPGRYYTQGAASCPACQVLPWGEIRLCRLHTAAPLLLKTLEQIEMCVEGNAAMRNLARAALTYMKERS